MQSGAGRFFGEPISGLDLVPPTLLRDGPHGWGSVQFFIDHDPEENFFTFRDDHVEALRQVALFDLVINNADRKGGHVIVGNDGRLWAIDHGIAFSHDPKLRTVIWDYATEPIQPELLARLQALQLALYGEEAVALELQALLNGRELRALQARVDKLLITQTYPEPGPGRPYPWPLV